MKKLLSILLVSVFLISCGSDSSNTTSKNETIEKKKVINVSFNKLYQSGNSIVCYTNDSDSLWMNDEWKRKIKRKMSKLKNGDVTVLLFNSKENTPNLNKYDFFDYPTSFDKHMVCGYWRFNYEKFCYGGVDEGGNFLKCEE